MVEWNQELISVAQRLFRKHPLRMLDAVQLASAILSVPALFVVSDKRLHGIAMAELKAVQFV